MTLDKGKSARINLKVLIDRALSLENIGSNILNFGELLEF